MSYKIIQDLYAKAISSGTDVVRWSDLLPLFESVRNRNTTNYTDINPVRFDDLPVFDDDAAAAAGGLIGGEEYQTTGGERRIKLPEVLP